jgi:hypothetical protein
MVSSATPPDENADQDTVYMIPHWIGELIALFCNEWAGTGQVFEIKGELLTRLTAEAKRLAGGS